MLGYGFLMIPAALICVIVAAKIVGWICDVIGPRIDRWHDR
jgi:hypothetical protein